MKYHFRIHSLIIPAVLGLLAWYITKSVPIGIATFGVLILPALIALYLPYAQDNPQHLWFKRKIYGWGWTPVTWQGWLSTLVFIALIVLPSLYLFDEQQVGNAVPVYYILYVAVLAALFIMLGYKKGERPRWSWGIDAKDTSDKKKD